MKLAAVLLTLVTAVSAQTPKELFTRFLYCHDFTRGTYEYQCVELNPDGTGAMRSKSRDTAEVKTDLALSKPALDRLLSILIRTRFLAGAANYESKKKVGDLGKKRLVVDTPDAHREAVFNYSEVKEVRDLVEFLDGLINQEMAVMSLEASLKYQRLAVSDNLQFIADEIQLNRIVDPERLAAVLERVQNDTRVLDFARETASRLRNQLLKKK